MSDITTIGTRMARALMIAAVTAVVLAVPVAAGAQDGPYPPPPEIRIVNPAVTVVIQGDDWGPGTEVTIIREDEPGASAQAARAAGTSTGGEQVVTVAQVDRTGSFTAEVPVPEGTEEMTVQASGVDASGAERVQDYVVTAQGAVPASPDRADGGLAVWQALALALLGFLVLTAATTVTRRRAAAGRSSE